MQVTIDSEEELERVLEVVGAMYGVRLTVVDEQRFDDLGDQGIVKVRH
ncbi:MAG: hypothetical protein JWP95_901 [Actinotalea sp.]|nr:hypothetical protein [Actinotalea sp.]